MKLNSKKFKGIFVFVFIATLTSCESENYKVPDQQEKTALSEEEGSTGELATITYLGQEVIVERVDGQYVMGGDMIVEDDETTGYSALGNKSAGRLDRKWPNNTVFYSIASNLPNKARVTKAIQHWESRTFVRFVKRTNQAAFVLFTPGSGCSSFVGRTGSKQNITLADGCSTGNTIHEIGHAVGLFHEQSRKDRNQFVTIKFENISSGKEHNFQTWNSRGFNGKDLTSGLDFGSIMMYGSKSFSKNGQATITRKNGSDYATQRTALSKNDIAGIQQLYPSAGNEFRYDLGTPSSPVFAGYKRISEKSKGIVEWNNTAGVISRDRGAKNGNVNNLNRDLVFSGQARTLQHKVSNGNWNVLITFGDANNARERMRVKAEGIIKLDNVATGKGKFINRSFNVNVKDGRLSLQFSDTGGPNPDWSITRIILTKK